MSPGAGEKDGMPGSKCFRQGNARRGRQVNRRTGMGAREGVGAGWEMLC